MKKDRSPKESPLQRTENVELPKRSQRKLFILAIALLGAMGGSMAANWDAWELAFHEPEKLFSPHTERAPLFWSDMNLTSDEFKPITVIDHVFPAIQNVPHVGVEESANIIKDEELVLGVVVGGEARAYPVNGLTGPQREIINDTLGGAAIAATW